MADGSMKSPVSVAVAARRTWPKRVAIALAVLAPLGILTYAVLEARGHRHLRQARMRLEQELGSLEPLVAPDVPDEDNVVNVLLKVEEIWWTEIEPTWYERSLEPGRLPRWMYSERPGAWSEARAEELERILARAASAVDAGRQAGSRAKLDYSVGEPSSLAFAFAGRLLLAEAGLALRRGDENAALESLGAVERISWAVSCGMLAFSSQIVERDFLQGVHWMVEDPNVSTETLAALLERWPPEPPAARLRRVIAGLAGIDLMAVETIDRGELEELVREMGILYPPGRPVSIPLRLRLYRWTPGALEMDAAERLDVHLQMARVADRPVLGYRPFELTQQLRSVLASYTNAYANHYELSFGLFKKTQSLAAARTLGRRALKLRLEALEAGRYPVEPSDLEPDPLTGTRPVYTVTGSGARLANPVARERLKHKEVEFDQYISSFLVWDLPPPLARGADFSASAESSRSACR